MPYIAVSRSPIHVREAWGETDPGFGNEPPVDPGFGRPGIGGPIDPGFGVGLPPVDPGYGRPGGIRPDNDLPTYPVRPGHDLPSPPTVWPRPPRPVGPEGGLPDVPVAPGYPIYLPPGGDVDNELPLPPGAVWPPLPPSLDDMKLLCFVWIVGVGYRWTVIDTSLKPENGLPPTTVPPAVDNELPPTPAPKA